MGCLGCGNSTDVVSLYTYVPHLRVVASVCATRLLCGVCSGKAWLLQNGTDAVSFNMKVLHLWVGAL